MIVSRLFRSFVLIGLFFCGGGASCMSAQGLKQQVYDYFVLDDLKGWKSAIDSVQRTGRMTESTLVDLINSQYGYIALLMAKKRNDEADSYIRLMSRNVQLLANSKQFACEYYAYSALCTMFQIPKNLLKAPSLAKQYSRQVDQAMELNPQSPFAVSLKAGGYYYRPKAFGGDKELAMRLYQQSEALYFKNGSSRMTDWNALGLLMTMARSYETMGNETMAELYRKKVITIEPRMKRRIHQQSTK